MALEPWLLCTLPRLPGSALCKDSLWSQAWLSWLPSYSGPCHLASFYPTFWEPPQLTHLHSWETKSVEVLGSEAEPGPGGASEVGVFLFFNDFSSLPIFYQSIFFFFYFASISLETVENGGGDQHSLADTISFQKIQFNSFTTDSPA